ncbi:MAG: excisionase [Alteromonadaceae bacterium]|nr:excisionase [Alteromonadaceae bacterium]
MTKKKLSELTGYSESALGNKVHDGVFREGFHYIRSPDNRLQFIISNIENYLSGER